MKLQVGLDGALYWFPDSCSGRPDQKLSGPFANQDAAYWWFVHHYEAQLSEKRKALWAEAVERAGTNDVALLMGLMMAICAGTSRDLVLKCARPVTGSGMDRKTLATGERAA